MAKVKFCTAAATTSSTSTSITILVIVVLNNFNLLNFISVDFLRLKLKFSKISMHF